jgi:hypothetical protein
MTEKLRWTQSFTEEEQQYRFPIDNNPTEAASSSSS